MYFHYRYEIVGGSERVDDNEHLGEHVGDDDERPVVGGGIRAMRRCSCASAHWMTRMSPNVFVVAIIFLSSTLSYM